MSKFFSLFLICFFSTATLLQAQQVVKALPGDNVNLTLALTSSAIQWQQSADGENWIDIQAATSASVTYAVTSLPIFLRAQVNEPDCEIRFSDVVKVERLITVPSLTTTSVSSITANGALAGGSAIIDGGGPIIDKGIVVSQTPAPTIANTRISSGSGSGNFSTAIESLIPSTLYYIRAYAVNSAGTGYGQEISFTTSATSPAVTLPIVSTSVVISITASSAITGGSITSDGGGPITGRGIVYATTPSPTFANAVVPSGSGSGTFQASLSNLLPSTQYYVRAYATNSAGTSYGNEVSFTTATVVNLAGLSGTVVSNITKNSASLSSTLTPSGTISAKGFVIGTSPSPTLANSQNVAGSGGNSFTGSATNLASGVVYFVRAYATNEAGTAYGAETSFRTSDSNVILMFVAHQQTYYTEFIVMKKALEASGYTVEVRSSSAGAASLYLAPADATISSTAATLPGGSHAQFTQQFLNLFGTAWDESLDNCPASTLVDGRIQDVIDMGPYRALVVVGGLGALAYRVDGTYAAQGSASASDVEAAAVKLNNLALSALSTGKPVMAQCHSASLPVFWRIPGTSGPGVESLGYSLLKNQHATGFPEPETPLALQPFGVVHRATNTTDGDRITISSPHSSFNDNGLGDHKIITTRDWYPQTVAHAARTLLNILESYPQHQQIAQARSVLILHGGAVNTSNCSAGNRSNDIPCNYGSAVADLPADFTDLQTLLANSPNDDFNFTVSQVNITSGSFPTNQNDILDYLDNYDVVVFYKHWSTGITNALMNALVTYADNGGGILALHHGLYNDAEGSQNKDIIINQLFGAESAPWSSLDDGTRLTYRLFSTNYGHFISTYAIGLSQSNPSLQAPAPWTTSPLNAKANASFSYYHNFQLFDELYDNMQFKPGVVFGRNINEITPIFSNDQNPSGQSHVSGFVRLFNQNGSDIGRVAYLQPGERKENYSQSSIFGQVIRNAVIWLSL